MAFKLPEFGIDADQYVPVTFNEDDVWIKKFQVGTWRIRLLDEPGCDGTPKDSPKFKGYREHYSKDIKKTFPCTEDIKTCVGCTSDQEATRRRPQQFAFNALDAEGNLQLYKVGVGLWKDLKDEQSDNGGTLLDRDISIKREGTTIDDTRYRLKLAGQPYDVNYSGKMHNIRKILGTHYLEACKALGIDIGEDDEPGDVAHEAPVSKTRSAAKSTTSAVASTEAVEDWQTSALKEYLDTAQIEYPAKGTRSVLEPLVKAHMKETVGF